MKVLQINSVCGYGSTGKIAVDLYQALEKQGHDCYIAYGRGAAPKDINTIKIGNKLNFYFHVLRTRLLDQQGFGSKRATRKFIEYIKEYNPDIIHLHNIHGYYINIDILFHYLKTANKPVIWTLHDCWSFTGHCAHFDQIKCGKWREQCQSCPLKKGYPQSWGVDFSKNNYKKKKKAFTGIKTLMLVSPSQWLAELTKESYLKKYPIVVIPNGIDRDIFKPLNKKQLEEAKCALQAKYAIDFSKKVFLGVASIWTSEKGFDDFIKIAQMDIEKVQVVLVGVSRKQKEKLPLMMVGIERTEDKYELVKLYACADAFLNPTYADTFPTVNMEAIACGTPVVSYNVGGSSESILDSCGFVVEKGNYELLLKKGLEVAEKVTIRDEECKCYDKHVTYSKYLELYSAYFKAE